jgi:hypothetical protein
MDTWGTRCDKMMFYSDKVSLQPNPGMMFGSDKGLCCAKAWDKEGR